MSDVLTEPAMTCQFTQKQLEKSLSLKLILHSLYPFLLQVKTLPNIMINFVVCLGHGIVVQCHFCTLLCPITITNQNLIIKNWGCRARV